jgi:hypothetical protein
VPSDLAVEPGWPSINVPAGFASDGLPIGVQLMGPANSEPLLISLAAELEAINGWVTKQPEIWWITAEGRSVGAWDPSRNGHRPSGKSASGKAIVGKKPVPDGIA